jgi:hypothetical protein
MATLNFRFIANDKGLQDGIKRSKKQLSSLERTTKTVATGMKRALSGVGLAIGVSALTSALASAGRAASEDAKSQRLLALQMKTTTNATAEQVSQTEDFIGKLSNQVGIMDDELRPAFAKLLRGTGKVSVAQKLLKIALDGSTASGKPLSTVSDALTKAFNGNFTTLYKLAPQLKKTKGGIDEYATSVKGAAKTGATSFSKLSTVLDNLNEQIGTALLPAFEGLSNFFIDNGPAISKFIQDLFNPKTPMGQAMERLGQVIDKVVKAVNTFFMQFDPDKKSGVLGFFRVLQAALDLVAGTLDIIINSLNLITGNEAAQKILNGKDVSNPFASAIDLGITKGAGIGAGGSNMSTLGSSNYTINVNKSNMAPGDIIREIQRYERQTGKKYLAK